MLHELEEERSSRRLEAYLVIYFFFFWVVVVGGRSVRYVTSLAIWNGIEGIQVPKSLYAFASTRLPNTSYIGAEQTQVALPSSH